MRNPTPEEIAVAGKVLQAIKLIDPGFYNADLAMADGWARVLFPSDYTLDEMLDGVTDFYRHEEKGRRCMPANVLAGARRARDAKQATPEGRAEIEARRERADTNWTARSEPGNTKPSKPANNAGVNCLKQRSSSNNA
ncbi:hypothetical protein [Corynebacterium guaraldiae]|uniref:hypothetical protein n=1 Tax=Corynebacterium guaraldiae TaxID=3051103 RepID=UPI001177D8F9|nr:hypothetical protein [Corynebacterium guaraldiae]TRX42514.1 hypothetical protein FNY89_03200 [Corynebacterium guaraldiae]